MAEVVFLFTSTPVGEPAVVYIRAGFGGLACTYYTLVCRLCTFLSGRAKLCRLPVKIA